MAVKVSNQTTILDITDGFSVIMTNENYTFLGNTTSVASTQSTTTQIMVMQGTEQIPCKIGQMTCPTGISAVSDGKSPVPTITITATTAVRQNGSFNIPIIVDDVTLNKTFSYSIAFTGQKGDTGAKGDKGETGATGAPGSKGDKGDKGADGADALTLVIISSNGNIFKNSAIATTLSAHVYKGGKEITGTELSALGTIKWYKDGSSIVYKTGSAITISAGDVDSRATFTAQLEG